MKKNVYIPSMDELSAMQDILNKCAANESNKMYKYCTAKLIEFIVAQGGLKFFSQEMRDIYEVARGVVKYNPEDVTRTKFADDFAELIISNNKALNTEFGLDNLQYFSLDLCESSQFVKKLVMTLSDTIKQYPEYRFNYRNSDLLNIIFDKELFENFNKNAISDIIFYYALLELEPAYILDFDLKDYYYECTPSGVGNILNQMIDKYASRFGLTDYDYSHFNERDITNTSDANCKRIVKCLELYSNPKY